MSTVRLPLPGSALSPSRCFCCLPLALAQPVPYLTVAHKGGWGPSAEMAAAVQGGCSYRVPCANPVLPTLLCRQSIRIHTIYVRVYNIYNIYTYIHSYVCCREIFFFLRTKMLQFLEIDMKYLPHQSVNVCLS